MVYRRFLTLSRRSAARSFAAGLLGLGALPVATLAAQAAKPPATKADSAKASTTKAPAKPAPAKPAPAKPSTATTKPASTKPSTTTTKPAPAKTVPAKTSTTRPAPATAAPAKTSTDAKAAPAPAATDAKPAASPAPASPARTVAPAASRAPNDDAGGGRRATVDAYSQVGLYVGGATAGLGFGAGPSGGIVWRLKSASLPFVFRADLSASRFTQQPLTNAGVVAGDASLLHAGAAVGFELVPGNTSQSLRPYLTVSGGIYRFQGSGPAGTNTDIVDGVFASTNDVALLAGAGLRLGQRLFLEARFVTVGDFQSIPVVIGVHF